MEALKVQFTGAKYSELVTEHLKKVGHQLELQFLTLEKTFTEEERQVTEFLIDVYNAKGYDRRFWEKDCGEVFGEIIERARNELARNNCRPQDSIEFNIFQFITLNFAHMARNQKGFRIFSGIGNNADDQRDDPLEEKQQISQGKDKKGFRMKYEEPKQVSAEYARSVILKNLEARLNLPPRPGQKDPQLHRTQELKEKSTRFIQKSFYLFKKSIPVAVVLFLISLVIEVGQFAPRNATVFIDPRDNKYFPEIFISEVYLDEYVEDSIFFAKSQYGAVKKQKLVVKEGMNTFLADRKLLFRVLNIPIWNDPMTRDWHFKKRWNKDGSWNW